MLLNGDGDDLGYHWGRLGLILGHLGRSDAHGAGRYPSITGRIGSFRGWAWRECLNEMAEEEESGGEEGGGESGGRGRRMTFYSLARSKESFGRCSR